MNIDEATRLSLVRALLDMELPLADTIRRLSVVPWDYDGVGVELTRARLVNALQRYLRSELSEADIELWANQIEGRDDVRPEAGSEAMVEEVLHELANPVLTQPLSAGRAAQLVGNLNQSG